MLSVPVDILFGRSDRILDHRLHGEATAGTSARVHLTLVDGGHMLPVTQPEATIVWLQSVAARMPSAADRDKAAVMTVSTHAANDAA
jgi:surfactin synthase thioesterase subunit